MTIEGKVHCFFEQSGTFKREFVKLGIPAEDYDIQNHFNETDHIIDLFAEIEKAYSGRQSVFDAITQDDLVLAFFPCIYFCDAKTIAFRCCSTHQHGWSLEQMMDDNIIKSEERQRFYRTLLQMVAVVSRKGLRMIIENPWNTSQATYLQNNFLAPTMIDHNRAKRGDYFVKPTAYWYLNCEPTYGMSYQENKTPQIVYKVKAKSYKQGVCDEERSMISPDYARNFICDFIIGKEQQHTLLTLF